MSVALSVLQCYVIHTYTHTHTHTRSIIMAIFPGEPGYTTWKSMKFKVVLSLIENVVTFVLQLHMFEIF